MVTQAQRDLVQQLAATFPAIAELLDDHVADCGDMLPHVVFGDITRYFVELVRSPLPDDDLKAVALLAELATAFERSDESVRELITVSFLENLLGEEPAARIRSLLSGALAASFDRVRAGGPGP